MKHNGQSKRSAEGLPQGPTDLADTPAEKLQERSPRDRFKSSLQRRLASLRLKDGSVDFPTWPAAWSPHQPLVVSVPQVNREVQVKSLSCQRKWFPQSCLSRLLFPVICLHTQFLPTMPQSMFSFR